jgi:DNA-binding protein H-NS
MRFQGIAADRLQRYLVCPLSTIEDNPMRKPRNFDGELKALGDKVRQLREQKLRQLGELVIATNADALPIDHLAGALLSAVEVKDAATKESWRKRGAAFFQRARTTGRETGGQPLSAAAGDGGAPSSASKEGA